MRPYGLGELEQLFKLTTV